MADTTPSYDFREVLVNVYEVLKRQEQILADLEIGFTALKSNLPGAESERLAQNMQTARRLHSDNYNVQLRLLNETVAQLRDS